MCQCTLTIKWHVKLFSVSDAKCLTCVSFYTIVFSLFVSVCIVCVQEKAMGNRPSEMMDREKAYIPELQISFMEHIAMPIYKCVQTAYTSHALIEL